MSRFRYRTTCCKHKEQASSCIDHGTGAWTWSIILSVQKNGRRIGNMYHAMLDGFDLRWKVLQFFKSGFQTDWWRANGDWRLGSLTWEGLDPPAFCMWQKYVALSGIDPITLASSSMSPICWEWTVSRVQPRPRGAKHPDGSLTKTLLQAMPYFRAWWYDRLLKVAPATSKKRSGVILYRSPTVTPASTLFPFRWSRRVWIQQLEALEEQMYVVEEADGGCIKGIC